MRCASLAALALAACGPGDPDAIEVSNMNPYFIAPKTAPADLVAAFDRYCLAPGSQEAAIAALRSADYVEHPISSADQRMFVTDSADPTVVLYPDRDEQRICNVLASARTGQTDRVRGFFADRFPGAEPLPANDVLAEGLVVATDPVQIVGIGRTDRPGAPARIVLVHGVALTP